MEQQQKPKHVGAIINIENVVQQFGVTCYVVEIKSLCREMTPLMLSSISVRDSWPLLCTAH
jgi:hypothetical protein